jgi:anti-sigma factor RsiW
MPCSISSERLGAYWDNELSESEATRLRAHIEQCGECTSRIREYTRIGAALNGTRARYPAPDTLRARIRSAMAADEEPRPVRARQRPEWFRLAAAVIITALVTGPGTYAVARRDLAARSTANAVVAAHVRSLMPGHLTDVASDEHHSVKPWFNGRVDLSPGVPNLDSLGFPLVGGRLDFIGDRAVAVVVYARRQHMINVFSWPDPAGESEPTAASTERGYHVLRWSAAGLETWVVSDLNTAELQEFVTAFTGAR